MTSQKYYAQYGEDRILNAIFNKPQGICVEVGGFDGVTGSNTLFFEKLGWECLIVEPMPDFCQKIKSARNCKIAEIAASDKSGEVEFHIASGVETLSTIEKNDDHFARIKGLSNQEIKRISVKTARLDDILLAEGLTNIDFITIDVEGHEMSVLAGMAFEAIQPRIVIIENNSYDMNPQVDIFMRTKSYIRFKKTGCNDWYAHKEDSLVSLWSVLGTEIPISLFVLKQKIKPFFPAWLKRKSF
ncbi:MAG: FkbM family methyltransferase [Gallionellaceae bacterium]|jgi:FkbM family methyltransferase